MDESAVGGGWWGASVACLGKACVVYGLPFLFRASAQAKEIPPPGRLHRAGKWAKPGTSLTAIGLARGRKSGRTSDNSWLPAVTIPPSCKGLGQEC